MPGLLAGGVATGLLLLVAAGPTPAHGDDSKPVVAGTFTVQLKTEKNTNPQIITDTTGTRTYTFGKGCAVGSACEFSRGQEDGSSEPETARAGGGALTWHTSTLVNCTDNATGALSTKDGGEFIQDGRLVPTQTAVRDGVTYVTQMRGVIIMKARITPKGRADNCTIPPDDTLEETARSALTATLVPLSAPPARTSPAPLGVEESAGTRESGTMPGFTLPQTSRQASSASAVASGTRSSVPGALVTPSEAIRTAGERLPQVLLLVALLGLLIVFPAQLFNSTYEENHERIDRRLARLRVRRRGPVVPSRPAGEPAIEPSAPAAPGSRLRRLSIFLACVLAGTVLGGLLDPAFGATTATYTLLLGIFASVLVAVLAAALTGRVFRSATHHAAGWYLQAIPSALLVAALCVTVSRTTHFQPGYLYGVLGGAVFAAALDRRATGRAEVATAGVGLVLALVAWVVFEPVSRAANHADPSFGVLTADAFLACLFIGGLEGLMLGLVPLRFLPGSRIKGWSWTAWAVLTVVVLYLFVHVLLMPESGYLGRSTAASVTVTIILFAAFAVVSVAFWLYFRLRPADQEGAGAPGTDVAQPEDESPATTPAPDPALVPADAQGNSVPDASPSLLSTSAPEDPVPS